jgi:glyoxylase-like metal-dependent hydrolase (beta-lactamase superfamily II)
VIDGAARDVELIEVAGNPHAEGLLAVHLPAERMLWVADLVRPGRDGRLAPPSERHLAEAFGAWLRDAGLRPAEILAPHMSAIGRAEHVESLLEGGVAQVPEDGR